MAFWAFIADVLADLELAQAADDERADEQADEQRGERREDAAEGEVPEDAEDAEDGVELFVEQPVEQRSSTGAGPEVCWMSARSGY